MDYLVLGLILLGAGAYLIYKGYSFFIRKEIRDCYGNLIGLDEKREKQN